nr:Gfo/Idh/MocA family oxidoreductase [Paenibacillus humicola]
MFAYSAPLLRDIEVEDTAVAVLKYKNGAFGVIQGTTSVYPAQETRFELHGEKGTIIFGTAALNSGASQAATKKCPRRKGWSTPAAIPPTLPETAIIFWWTT